MITFNELNTAQLAALTDDQIELYIRTESMEEGIPLGTRPAGSFQAETRVDMNETEYFIVERDGSDVGILFDTEEDAQAFTRMSFSMVDTKYLSGYSVSKSYAKKPEEVRVARRRMPSESDVMLNLAELEAAAMVTKANRDLNSQLEQHSSAVNKVRKRVWDSVYEARSTVRRLDDVRACWAEYQGLARDMPSAIACMRKAYERDEALLADALGAEWSSLPAEILAEKGN